VTAEGMKRMSGRLYTNIEHFSSLVFSARLRAISVGSGLETPNKPEAIASSDNLEPRMQWRCKTLTSARRPPLPFMCCTSIIRFLRTSTQTPSAASLGNDFRKDRHKPRVNVMDQSVSAVERQLVSKCKCPRVIRQVSVNTRRVALCMSKANCGRNYVLLCCYICMWMCK
jgi:hypothetical protein